MYKVVIIDDEAIIVEGMSKCFPWDKWDCKVVAAATDGEEGRRIIEEYKPHIIITDIAMPGIDGLKMLAGLKSEFAGTEITILTGYRNFEYAQQAVKLGVRRLLLKPSVMSDIEEAVEAMVENLKMKETVFGEKSNEESIEAVNSSIVKSALKYIENYYNEQLTLSEVAEHVYVSKWHLSKLLNQQTGRGFSEILNIVRINRAKELLVDRSLRISDVSELVGFVNLPHFSRVFKRIAGVSANEYRNKLQQQIQI